VATATYQAQEDTLGGFLSECCQTGPHDSVSNTALYVAYQQWTGGRCESHRAFSMHLKARALETYQVKGLRFWRGISLVNKDLGDE
jgi:phage/plasmid-associated DNA primase